MAKKLNITTETITLTAKDKEAISRIVPVDKTNVRKNAAKSKTIEIRGGNGQVIRVKPSSNSADENNS